MHHKVIHSFYETCRQADKTYRKDLFDTVKNKIDMEIASIIGPCLLVRIYEIGNDWKPVAYNGLAKKEVKDYTNTKLKSLGFLTEKNELTDSGKIINEKTMSTIEEEFSRVTRQRFRHFEAMATDAQADRLW